MLQVVFKPSKMCQNKVTMTKRPFILARGEMKNIYQGFFFSEKFLVQCSSLAFSFYQMG